MKTLLFSLFICTTAAVQAQTLPRSSEKNHTDKLWINQSHPFSTRLINLISMKNIKQ